MLSWLDWFFIILIVVLALYGSSATRRVQHYWQQALDYNEQLIDAENRWAAACAILGIPEDSSSGRLRDAVAALKRAPKPCWIIVDYEDDFVLVEAGNMYGNGSVSSDRYIVPMVNFEQSKRAWEVFHEDWQFTECPYLIDEPSL